jgi:predicted metal-dependent hydrolase
MPRPQPPIASPGEPRDHKYRLFETGRCTDPPPPALVRAVREFNAGDYFQCHETLEHAWLHEPGYIRVLWQGIIQVSVACFHITRGNGEGARKIWTAALLNLQPFPDRCLGVDVAALRAQTNGCLQMILALGDGGAAQFDRALFPHIEMDEGAHTESMKHGD